MPICGNEKSLVIIPMFKANLSEINLEVNHLIRFVLYTNPTTFPKEIFNLLIFCFCDRMLPPIFSINFISIFTCFRRVAIQHSWFSRSKIHVFYKTVVYKKLVLRCSKRQDNSVLDF